MSTLANVVSCHSKGIVPLAAEFIFGAQYVQNVFQGYLEVTVESSEMITGVNVQGKAEKLTIQQYFRVDMSEVLAYTLLVTCANKVKFNYFFI